MDEEIKNLLEKNLEVSQKSLEILTKMRRDIMWGRALTALKWIVLVGLIIFGTVKAWPYLMYWGEVLTTIANSLQKLMSIFPAK